MNEAYENILSRRSIREYTTEPVTKDQIELILKAAMAAPSANGVDPWRFIVVTDKVKISKLGQGILNGQKVLATAPVALIVCGDIERANRKQESYLLQDCSAAIQNSLLGAKAIGLDSCWIGVHPNIDRMKYISNLFELEQNIIPVAIIGIGYGKEKKDFRTRYCQDFVRWE